MGAREWLLSLSFAAFVVLEVAEGWWAIEEWPLTHVPMFETLRPEHELPRRAALYALRGGRWFEMRPFHFRLNPDELGGRLLYGEDVAAACGELVRAFNASRPPERRVSAAYVLTTVVARPQAPERGSGVRTDCDLEGEPP
ncbi:MAG: hypothetical protein AB1689_05520 [Thermodesulfobacteriota bacterium]